MELGDGNGPLPGQDGRWIWSGGVGLRWADERLGTEYLPETDKV